MAGGGRVNRQAEAQRRTAGANFFGHEVSCARRPQTGEKSANRRFQATGVRHRSIEQKQGEWAFRQPQIKRRDGASAWKCDDAAGRESLDARS